MGLEHAQGAWISFVDSDDFLRSDCIEMLYSLCLKHNVSISQCGVVRGTEENFPSKDNEIVEKKWCFKVLYKSKERDFRGVVCAKLLKCEVVKDYYFPENIKIAEDESVDFKWLYVAKECVIINKHMYYYYIS